MTSIYARKRYEVLIQRASIDADYFVGYIIPLKANCLNVQQVVCSCDELVRRHQTDAALATQVLRIVSVIA